MEAPPIVTMEVIVPVFNALDQVKRCLSSLVSAADEFVRIRIIDDASHAHVATWLRTFAKSHPQVSLHVNPKNIGYLHSVNSALATSTADAVVLLNSDTIVFDTLFPGLRTIFAEHQDVGIVNPVSTWANWTRVPLPPGKDIWELNAHLTDVYGTEMLNVASGFCFALRRQVVQDVGLLDEAYSPGYWEETDYCLRALDAGWRVVSAPGLFVFHHGWSSFGSTQRNLFMSRNESAFRARWGDRFDHLEHQFRFGDTLRDVKAELTHGDWALARSQGNAAVVARSGPSVMYVVPNLPLYGGVISVVQVANQLALRGLHVRIAVVGGTDTAALRYGPSYIQPVHYGSEAELLAASPQVDVAVATHWSTAYHVIKLKELGIAARTVYFVQDYEPDFHEHEPDKKFLAEMSYRLLPDQICKSVWLKRKLESHGGNPTVIPLGLNLDVFADFGLPRRPTVVGMARPSSPRRNWPTLLRLFSLLRRWRPDIDLAVYGFGFKDGDLPDGVTNFGLLNTGPEVASLLNQATILVDPSHYQGFGRPGIEAMACGVVPVLTKNGGITSYATHDVNCLLSDPMDVAAMAEGIVRLCDDSDFYAQLKQGALRTAAQYSLDSEGDRTEMYLRTFA